MFPVINSKNLEIDPVKNIQSGTLFTDLVDEIIEEGLENDGDVEFVEERFLIEFMHVALIHR